MSKLPTATDQGSMRNAIHSKVVQVGERLAGPFEVEPLRSAQLPEDSRDFKIDDLRCGETLSRQALARTSSIITIVAECRDEDAGIDNYQRAPRSERTDCAAVLRLTRPPER